LWMDRHDDANSRFSQFENEPKNIARIASHGNLKPGGVVEDEYKSSQMY